MSPALVSLGIVCCVAHLCRGTGLSKYKPQRRKAAEKELCDSQSLRLMAVESCFNFLKFKCATQEKLHVYSLARLKIFLPQKSRFKSNRLSKLKNVKRLLPLCKAVGFFIIPHIQQFAGTYFKITAHAYIKTQHILLKQRKIINAFETHVILVY